MTLFNNSSLPRHPIARDHTGHFYGTHPWQSMTLVSKWNIKLALIWKEDFGPLGNSTVLLFLSPGKTPLTTTAANISILPKISRFWLFALCRLIVMTLFHESYLQRSIALVVLWCHTMIGAQLQDQLCTIPACYWSNYFGCFKQYKISWPGHVPYKCHMATLAPFGEVHDVCACFGLNVNKQHHAHPLFTCRKSSLVCRDTLHNGPILWHGEEELFNKISL